MWCVFFFFFKQKTAYEMRISDWSSDVCSSDLAARTEMGWVAGPQTWTLGGEAPSSAGGDIHAAHDHAAMMQAMPTPAQSASSVGLNDIVAKAMPEQQIGRASCRERVCQYV